MTSQRNRQKEFYVDRITDHYDRKPNYTEWFVFDFLQEVGRQIEPNSTGITVDSPFVNHDGVNVRPSEATLQLLYGGLNTPTGDFWKFQGFLPGNEEGKEYIRFVRHSTLKETLALFFRRLFSPHPA